MTPYPPPPRPPTLPPGHTQTPKRMVVIGLKNFVTHIKPLRIKQPRLAEKSLAKESPKCMMNGKGFSYTYFIPAFIKTRPIIFLHTEIKTKIQYRNRSFSLKTILEYNLRYASLPSSSQDFIFTLWV